jgi:putative transposase
MTDTEIVPGRRDREPADRPPLVDAALADELLARAQTEGVELLGPDGLLSQVTKAVLERALEEEMTEHLGYEKHDPAGRGSGNSRNGVTGKRLLTEIGGIELEVPAIGAGRSVRRSCAKARPAWMGSTTASSRCMPAA